MSGTKFQLTINYNSSTNKYRWKSRDQSYPWNSSIDSHIVLSINLLFCLQTSFFVCVATMCSIKKSLLALDCNLSSLQSYDPVYSQSLLYQVFNETSTTPWDGSNPVPQFNLLKSWIRDLRELTHALSRLGLSFRVWIDAASSLLAKSSSSDCCSLVIGSGGGA